MSFCGCMGSTCRCEDYNHAARFEWDVIEHNGQPYARRGNYGEWVYQRLVDCNGDPESDFRFWSSSFKKADAMFESRMKDAERRYYRDNPL